MNLRGSRKKVGLHWGGWQGRNFERGACGGRLENGKSETVKPAGIPQSQS